MIRLKATAIPLPVARWADGKTYSIVSVNGHAEDRVYTPLEYMRRLYITVSLVHNARIAVTTTLANLGGHLRVP